jgi:hypothetical protein
LPLVAARGYGCGRSYRDLFRHYRRELLETPCRAAAAAETIPRAKRFDAAVFKAIAKFIEKDDGWNFTGTGSSSHGVGG